MGKIHLKICFALKEGNILGWIKSSC